MQAYGRDWSRLHAAVPAKTLTQIKNYYQNYRTRLGLDKLALPPSAVQPGSRKRKGGGGGSGGERGGLVASRVARSLRAAKNKPVCIRQLGVAPHWVRVAVHRDGSYAI